MDLSSLKFYKLLRAYLSMTQKCVICSEKIPEEYRKLKGTIVKATNEKGVNDKIYVCSECMKQDGWIEKAKIKGA